MSVAGDLLSDRELYNDPMIAERILNRLVDRLAEALAPPVMALRPWLVDGHIVGEIDDHRARALARFDHVFSVDADAVRFRPALTTPALRTRALDDVARALAAEGALTRWRDERYAVAATFDAPPLCLLERAAARFFGIRSYAAHLNGTTLRDGATRMWLARRSLDKAIDPGQLDNLVGGGVPTGESIAATLVKEAWEEAGLPAELALTARAAGAVQIRRAQPDGLHRDTIHVHDLELPARFVPSNQDGEVTEFRLTSPDQVAELAGSATGEDVVTADASLVIADWLLRHGFVPMHSVAQARIEKLRRGEAA